MIFLFDRLSYNIANAQEIIRKGGYRAFLNEALRRKPFYGQLLVPFAARKLKSLQRERSSGSLKETIDFSFGFSYLGINMRPVQVRSEITKLLEILKKRKPKSILEIGTANGGTLFLFAKVSDRNARIVSIDNGYPRWREKLYRAFALPSQKLYLLRSNSHDSSTLKRARGLLGGARVDFLFIDGDHTYEGVKKDFAMYSKLVKKGGVIGFHDIVVHPPEAECEVDRLFNEVKKRYRSSEIVENRKQGWGGIGVLYT